MLRLKNENHHIRSIFSTNPFNPSITTHQQKETKKKEQKPAQQSLFPPLPLASATIDQPTLVLKNCDNFANFHSFFEFPFAFDSTNRRGSTVLFFSGKEAEEKVFVLSPSSLAQLSREPSSSNNFFNFDPLFEISSWEAPSRSPLQLYSTFPAKNELEPTFLSSFSLIARNTAITGFTPNFGNFQATELIFALDSATWPVVHAPFGIFSFRALLFDLHTRVPRCHGTRAVPAPGPIFADNFANKGPSTLIPFGEQSLCSLLYGNQIFSAEKRSETDDSTQFLVSAHFVAVKTKFGPISVKFCPFARLLVPDCAPSPEPHTTLVLLAKIPLREILSYFFYYCFGLVDPICPSFDPSRPSHDQTDTANRFVGPKLPTFDPFFAENRQFLVFPFFGPPTRHISACTPPTSKFFSDLLPPAPVLLLASNFNLNTFNFIFLCLTVFGFHARHHRLRPFPTPSATTDSPTGFVTARPHPLTPVPPVTLPFCPLLDIWATPLFGTHSRAPTDLSSAPFLHFLAFAASFSTCPTATPPSLPLAFDLISLRI